MTHTSRLKSYRNILRDNVPTIILAVFFLTEFLTKFLEYYGFEYHRIGVVFKVLFVIIILLNRVLPKSMFWQLSLLCVLFVISQVFIDYDLSFYEGVSKNVLYLSKYLFIFVVAAYFRYLKLNSAEIDHLINVVFFLLWVNFVVILIGILFNIGLFATYGPNRFGYNGLIHINSHSSYIYIFALIYVVYNYIKTKKYSANFWMIVLSALLIGTKTSYLFCGLVAVYLWFYYRIYKSLAFYSLAILLLFSGFIFQEKLMSLFTTHYSAFVMLYNDSGIITALASRRNLILGETLALAFQEYWVWINYMIGGGFFNEIRTEMAFVDLFLFWGVLGMFAYLKLYYNYVIKAFMFHPFLRYAIFSLFIACFFGGNFFTNAVIAIYIVVFANFFILEKKKL